ncbi:MAG: TIGR00282 family metallophosphoesterase [bacterium]|nr:TIGR00282 family metallophosphoesterase [bacterium]
MTTERAQPEGDLEAPPAAGGIRILFVGDVVGKPGRRVLKRLLESLVDRRHVDYVVVNIENVAGGWGITPDVFRELDELPIDCYTSGNHIWDRNEGLALLDVEPRLLRPANYPAGNPGHGVHVGETAAGVRVATINLEGQVFMKNLESPFVVADRLLAELPAEVKIIVVDFHAEATSEKQAMGFYLDARVSAVLGTHTHVPTADERILAGGTAFITDVGMTGPYEGVIGYRVDKVLQRFELQRNIRIEAAKRDVRLAGAVVDVDAATGRAKAVERLLVSLDP